MWVVTATSVSRVLNIEVAFFYETRVGLAFPYLCIPEGEIHSQGWPLGWDVESKPGLLALEFEILFGCRLVPQCLQCDSRGSPSQEGISVCGVQ